MQGEKYWHEWAQFLQHRKLHGFSAFLLDAGGPLINLAAQLMYTGAPFFTNPENLEKWQAAASMLENREDREAFIKLLQEEKIAE